MVTTQVLAGFLIFLLAAVAATLYIAYANRPKPFCGKCGENTIDGWCSACDDVDESPYVKEEQKNIDPYD